MKKNTLQVQATRSSSKISQPYQEINFIYCGYTWLTCTSISLCAKPRTFGKNSLRTTLAFEDVLASNSRTDVPEEFNVLDGVLGSIGDVCRLYSLRWDEGQGWAGTRITSKAGAWFGIRVLGSQAASPPRSTPRSRIKWRCKMYV